MTDLKLPAHYYQQFDADPDRDVPGEGYGGWESAEVTLSWEHTALVVMHAWDVGPPETVPGWYRAVEYLPRADAITRDVLAPLLATARASGFRVFHVVGGGDYYRQCPGHQRAIALAGSALLPEHIEPDDALEALRSFRAAHAFPGAHNAEDIERGSRSVGFTPEVRPQDDEGVAENTHQLFALCRDAGVSHLVYVGFAVNWCILMSPGGMIDMGRHGMMCSVLREAVTAVENRESARGESHKEEALWRIAVGFGFVFDVADFASALRAAAREHGLGAMP